MDVNEHERLFSITNVKELRFYCCFTFHIHNWIFNVYPKIGVKRPLNCHNWIFNTLIYIYFI